jgi:DNA-binding MarR family transcriptional regulator
MENKQSLILFKIKHLDKLLEANFARRLDKVGLTPQQGRILFFVCKSYKNDIPINQNTIKDKFELSKSTTSGLVKRLMLKSLIAIKKDKNNNLIVPTEEGLKLKDYFIENADRTFKNVLGDLDENTSKLIVEQIDNIIERLKKEENADAQLY